MFSKKKKKPLISPPTNFQHRVHTGYDRKEGRYVGLPLQWAGIIGNNQILRSTNRPLPMVDPSEITPTDILDLKVRCTLPWLFECSAKTVHEIVQVPPRNYFSESITDRNVKAIQLYLNLYALSNLLHSFLICTDN